MTPTFRTLIVTLISLVLTSLNPVLAGGGTLYAGMYPDDFWENTEILNNAASWAGKRMTFGGTFLDASEDPSNIMEKLDQVWAAQATPFANIEVTGNTANVASGALDAEIMNLATSVKAWLDKGEGRSVIIAPMQEMNLQESRWGCDAANFPTAYRKFVTAFQQVGIDNDTQVRWAFAPNGWTTPACGSIAPFYPGDDVVDIIGISAYNFGPNEWDGKYRAPSEIYTYLNELRGFAPNKPYLIAQTGTAPVGGDRDAWLREMFSVLSADPNTVGFLYFNKDKSSWGGNEWDWRIFDERALSGATGFIDGMQNPSTLYQWPLTSWFQPGALPVNP
jgi:Glycosyl hydrolase family 26